MGGNEGARDAVVLLPAQQAQRIAEPESEPDHGGDGAERDVALAPAEAHAHDLAAFVVAAAHDALAPDGRRVAARPGLGEGEAGDLLARGEARQVVEEELFKRVAEHRQAFFRWSWVDYDTLRRGTLRLLPPEGQVAAWRHDYEAMAGSMFFGKVPTFEDVLKIVGDFERRFNERP